MLSENQFRQYISYFNDIHRTREILENEYDLCLDGIYDNIYLIMDMVIDSNLTEKGRDLFWHTYYELNVRDFGPLWEIVKNNYNYEPTK